MYSFGAAYTASKRNLIIILFDHISFDGIDLVVWHCQHTSTNPSRETHALANNTNHFPWNWASLLMILWIMINHRTKSNNWCCRPTIYTASYCIPPIHIAKLFGPDKCNKIVIAIPIESLAQKKCQIYYMPSWANNQSGWMVFVLNIKPRSTRFGPEVAL